MLQYTNFCYNVFCNNGVKHFVSVAYNLSSKQSNLEFISDIIWLWFPFLSLPTDLLVLGKVRLVNQNFKVINQIRQFGNASNQKH